MFYAVSSTFMSPKRLCRLCRCLGEETEKSEERRELKNRLCHLRPLPRQIFLSLCTFNELKINLLSCGCQLPKL